VLSLFRLVWRRRRWRHGRPRLRWAVAWLAAMVVLFVAAMAAFEDMAPQDSLWLAIVTLTTVGYGDVAAKTGAGRIATVLLLLLGGVFVVAKVASDWFDWREEVRARKRAGSWRWGMEGHVLVIGTPVGDAVRFFHGLVRQLRGSPGYQGAPVLLLTRAFAGSPDGLPQVLCDAELVHVQGAPTDPDALRLADAAAAAAVIVLAENEDDAVSDAISADVVARVRAMAAGAPPVMVAECVDDRNRARLIAAGAAAAVRPLRSYPEMLARALVAPGSERLLEDLFSSEGNELFRLDLPTSYRGSWAGVAGLLLDKGLGTAIAYRPPDGEVVLNPAGAQAIEAVAVYVILRESQKGAARDLAGLLVAR
jgi:voltage-gated potassium channel